MMKRVAKPEGFGNIVGEDAPIPAVGPREVLVQARVSLESAGELTAYEPPSGPGIRVDGYCYAGYVAGPAYDPLLDTWTPRASPSTPGRNPSRSSNSSRARRR